MEPRLISGADQIPVLGGTTVSLIVPRKTPPSLFNPLIGAGARCKRKADGLFDWWIERQPYVDLDAIDVYLPRLARRAVTPTLPDLIPATAWGASLANILARSSWDKLRHYVFEQAPVCIECGHRRQLECHEVFTYADGVQRLVGLEAVCNLCHMIRHWGFAQSRGFFDQVLSRFAVINRLTLQEAEACIEIVEARWIERSRQDWALDLSMIANMGMLLANDIRVGEGGFIETRRRSRRMSAKLLGVELRLDFDGWRLSAQLALQGMLVF